MLSVPPTRSNVPLCKTRSSLACRPGGDVADFIEQQGPAVGHLEPADLPPFGAGERPLFVAEELAFQQRVVQDGAVERHERTGPARIGGVQRLRDQLLAGPGLALDQDRRAHRPDLLDQVEQLANLRALGDHRVKMIVAAHLLAQLLELVDQLAAIEDALDQEPEVIGLVGLGDKIVGAGLHRPERLGRVAERGQDDHAHRKPLGAHLREQIQSAQVGHPQVGDHQVVSLGSKLVPGRAAVADGVDFKAVGFENLAEVMAVELHVVDGEDAAHMGSSILVKNRHGKDELNKQATSVDRPWRRAGSPADTIHRGLRLRLVLAEVRASGAVSQAAPGCAESDRATTELVLAGGGPGRGGDSGATTRLRGRPSSASAAATPERGAARPISGGTPAAGPGRAGRRCLAAGRHARS